MGGGTRPPNPRRSLSIAIDGDLALRPSQADMAFGVWQLLYFGENLGAAAGIAALSFPKFHLALSVIVH
jgi:hypothetical protein